MNLDSIVSEVKQIERLSKRVNIPASNPLTPISVKLGQALAAWINFGLWAPRPLRHERRLGLTLWICVALTAAA